MKHLCFALMTLILLTLTFGAASGAETFFQDRFAIGLWVDPPLDEKADARYRNSPTRISRWSSAASAARAWRRSRNNWTCAKNTT